MTGRGVRSDFLIGAAIGSGNTALAAERGGADFLLAINAGRLRNMGAPSIACMLPIFDAGSLTHDFARRELLTQCSAPVLLGIDVWGEDIDLADRARWIRDAGFAGAVNFPSCMHYSRAMQQILSRAGRGIEREVAQLRAVQDVGLTSMFYCATRTQARLAADAGLDMVCLNLGWNVGGAIGHRRRVSIEEVATVAHEIGRLIKRINPGTRFLLEGGPIASAEDLGRVVSLARIDGYVGGSTIDRIPLENSVSDQIDRFRQASKGSATLDVADADLVSWAAPFGFVGHAKSQLDFFRRLRAFAGADAPLLLLAEKGLDVEPVLRALVEARRSARAKQVVEVDVAGEEAPERARNLLFGHRDTLGRHTPAFGDASIGLLAIRAPERLPPATQQRLARTLHAGCFQVTGTRKTLPLSPRVVLVCDASIPGSGIDSGLAGIGLGEALRALISGWELQIPPLRERIDDLLAIVERISAQALDAPLVRSDFSSDALARLHAYRWPGNEAEVRSLVGALAGRGSREPVQLEEIAGLIDRGRVPVADSRSEKDLIVDALWRHAFNRTRTAASLGMTRKTLYNKMLKYGLSG
ncbi:MAG: hypothetical protein DWQ08_07805 [Proteobacteria bacterium]|nr:MAG: hypothetical protein DWQ08_07805 [Pseudomonadota bacterium]